MAKQDRTGVTARRKGDGTMAYRAQAHDAETGRTVYKTFSTPKAAQNWRQDRIIAFRHGHERALEGVPLQDLVADWQAGVEAGTVRGRGGHPYKPSVLRQYEQKWTAVLRPRFGTMKVKDLRTKHVQALADELLAAGASPSTINNTITPLRVFMRYAIRRELAATNPCDGLELPTGETARDRVASPGEARLLIEALPTPEDRAIWAVAFYTGMRRGEIMALEWSCVDLYARTVAVVRAYDPPTKTFVATKNRGRRVVGIPAVLIPYLAALNGTEGLVFRGLRDHHAPFNDSRLLKHSRAAWAEAGLEPIGLHECRHTYASVMIHAGINIKALSEMMGHASVAITWDRYGHLMPGATLEAMSMIDAYLEKELA